MLIAAQTKAESGGHSSVLLVVIAVLLLVVGIGAIVLLVRSMRGRGTGNSPPREDTLLEMLLASEEPAFRDYLQRSGNPGPGSGEEADDSRATLRRIASISLPKPAERPAAISLNEVVLGLALLESRLTDLAAAAVRIEKQSVTKDRMVWSILGTFGAIVAVLGGIVALATATSQLVSG